MYTEEQARGLEETRRRELNRQEDELQDNLTLARREYEAAYAACRRKPNVYGTGYHLSPTKKQAERLDAAERHLDQVRNSLDVWLRHVR
jgi:hypothetical protein